MNRVVRFHEFGGPEVLRVEKAVIPPPAADQVRIDIKAIGLNRAEVLMRSGQYIETPKLPSGLGLEASGFIESVGENVRQLKPGQLVGLVPPISMQAWPTYADRANFPAELVIPSPAGFSPVETAGLWMALLTAYGALIDIGRVQKGHAVVITAASSSVGLAAIQIANLVGAKPIAISRNLKKADQLKAHGAAEVVTLEENRTTEQLIELTSGVGVDLAFDAVGGPLLAQLAASMRPGGTIIQYGGLSQEPQPYPFFDILVRQLTVRGYLVHHITADQTRLSQAKTFLLRALSQGQLRPKIDAEFPLERVVDAHRYLEAGDQVGKVVLTT